MKVIFGIHHLVALPALGLALLGAAGCEGDHSTATATIEPDGSARIEPKYSPPKQSVEDLKKDIKPPVVVKPGAPAGSAVTPPSPNPESR